MKFSISNFQSLGKFPSTPPLRQGYAGRARLRRTGRTGFAISKRGFTLIEVIVAVFLFSLIMLGLFAFIAYIFNDSKQQGSLLSDANQARLVAAQVINQLRNAQTGDNGAYTLDTTASQQLVFYSDVDSSGGTQRVRYFLQNGKLIEGITDYNGSSYNTSTERTIAVQNDVANSSTPLFYYYDGTYTGSATQTPLVQPVNPASVKLVQLNLEIYNKGGVRNTNYYTVTGVATIRNLKTNLAQ